MPKDFGRKMTMDSRMVQEIRRSPSMMQEQGSGWLDSWGGVASYEFWTHQPIADRLVYFCVQEGYTSVPDIAAATDLTTARVNASVARLVREGLLEEGVVS